MKKITVLMAGLLILVAAGCNKEIISNDNNSCSDKISVNAVVSNDSKTKITYTDNGESGIKVDWSDNESFYMYCGSTSEGNLFSKDKEGNLFTGTKPAGNDTYYAVYGNDITNNSGVLTIDLSSQVGTASDNCIKEFMVAQANDLSGGFAFSHKLAVLKLSLTLPSGTEGVVDKVSISGMHNKADFNLTSGSYATMTNDNKGEIVATGESGNGFTISDNSILAYVSVFPETVAANKIEITAKVGSNYFYYILKNSNTLTEGKVVPVSVILEPKAINSASPCTFEEYYWWDAYNNYKIGTEEFSEGNHGFNDIASGQASHSCKDCISKDELISYIKAGCYWDAGTVGDESNGLQSFTLADGVVVKTGVWFLKRAYIDNFGASNTALYLTTKLSTASKPTTYKEITAENAADIRTSGKYFFIPTCGFPSSNPKQPNTIVYGYEGAYWSSTALTESTTLKANGLSFSATQILISKKAPRSSNCRRVFAE